MSVDPPRWSSDASDGPDAFRRMLREAKQVGPTRDEAARVFERLESGGATTAATSIGVAASALAAIALVVAGVWTLRTSSHDDAGALENLPPASGFSAPAPLAPDSPAASVNPPPPAMPPAVVLTPAAGATKQGAPSQEAPPASKVATPAGAARGAPSAKPSEAALLHAARAELAVNPARAVELLQLHRATYPSGILSEERDALLVEALGRAGKAQAASKEREAFKAAHPESALQPK